PMSRALNPHAYGNAYVSSVYLHAFIDQFEVLNYDVIHSKTLLCSLAKLPDPRARRGIRHPLANRARATCSVLLDHLA
ncbi:transposase family protein, partial [Glutamicibacter sp. BW80]|uniref:transposase family protein n=1 Tax=Glutamicibacter sp. BW80 TaxID=2024404 RepID=UPI001C3F00C4